MQTSRNLFVSVEYMSAFWISFLATIFQIVALVALELQNLQRSRRNRMISTYISVNVTAVPTLDTRSLPDIAILNAKTLY